MASSSGSGDKNRKGAGKRMHDEFDPKMVSKQSIKQRAEEKRDLEEMANLDKRGSGGTDKSKQSTGGGAGSSGSRK